MTTEPGLSSAACQDHTESLTLEQKEALERAVAKVVELGAQVGVDTDQMILLLRSGLSVGELLDYLAARSGKLAGKLA